MQLSENVLQQKFLQQYQRTLPHKACPEITQFARLATGWESEIFALTLAYQEGNARSSADLILKIVLGQHRKEKATLEYANIRSLARLGYPVPQIMQFSAKADEPGPYILMEQIKGQSLKDAMQSASDDRRRDELLHLFCSLLVRLHRLDWKPFMPYPALYLQHDLLVAYLTALETPLRSYGISAFQGIFAWLYERVQTVQENAEAYLAVSHQDFHSENVLLRHDATPVVIDWGNLMIADSRLDLAWTCLLDAPLRDALLAEYQRVAGCQIEHFDFFEVIAYLRGMITVFFSINLQATDLGLGSSVEPFMRQQGSQIEQGYALLKRRTGLAVPEIEQIIESLRDDSYAKTAHDSVSDNIA